MSVKRDRFIEIPLHSGQEKILLINTPVFRGITYAKKSERAGKRVKIELHHKQDISKGGDVYNIDNLNAVTPKRHIEIHKGK
ncbi:HNH endonuclease [Kosakonia oryziphila]|uniref:HNH endonuclease signature motif containing protein n=1 Tax=Kosakonia oryziphila TaxID=1005667 RepID=UPI003CC55A86